MNYKGLIQRFAKKNNLSKVTARAYLDDVFDIIINAIKSDDRVLIRNLGVFKKRICKEKLCINPRQPSIKFKRKPFNKAVFKIGKFFKSFLNN